MNYLRINDNGQYQVNTSGRWEDCSEEEFNELLEGGYILIS